MGNLSKHTLCLELFCFHKLALSSNKMVCLKRKKNGRKKSPHSPWWELCGLSWWFLSLETFHSTLLFSSPGFLLGISVSVKPAATVFSYDAPSRFLIWRTPLQGFILPGLLFLCTLNGLSLDRNSNLNDGGHKRLIFGPAGHGETRIQPCWKEQHWDSAPWGTSVCWEDEGISDGVWDGSYSLK